jgi:hypothetical protein
MAISNNSLDKRVSSLVKYILDIKPYHTKLLGFTSELSFSDSLDLTLVDSQPHHTVHHQNVWTARDIPSLSLVSDGTSESQTFVVPPTVMPRFSVTDSLNYGQSPLGDDQALSNLTDTNGDGVPNAGYPWAGQASSSHQSGADFIPVRLALTSLNVTVTSATASTYTATVTGGIATGYATVTGIPLGAVELRMANGPTTVIDAQGGTFNVTISGTYSQGFFPVNGTLLPFSDASVATAYIYKQGFEVWAVSNTGRYAVPWHNAAHVRVNNIPKDFGNNAEWVTGPDRNYIQFLAGQHPSSSAKIDINLMNADRMYIAKAAPFIYEGSNPDYFTLTVSNAAPGRRAVSFHTSELGVRKAILQELVVSSAAPDGMSWKLTAANLFTLAVQRQTPTVGPIEYVYVNEPYSNGYISFTLRAPWVEYYLTHGVGSYVAFDMSLYDDEEYDRPADEADIWPDPAIKTKLGQPYDPLPPLHAPVQFIAVGELKQREINGQPQYIFQLFDVPPQGTFVELRIEQAKQLNPRLQLGMRERLNIIQMAGSSGSTTTIYDTEVYSGYTITAGGATAPAAPYVYLITETGDNRETELGDIRILE